MNKRLPLGLACIFALTLSAHAAESSRYTLLLDNGTRVAGQEIDQTRDNGLSTIHYVFKDNGRGPEFDEEYRIAADGMLSDYKIKGHTTFGSLINERFSRKAGKAEWRSDSEKGSTTLVAAAMYVPLNSNSLGIVTAFFRAMQRQPDKALPLLPGGELRMRAIQTLELRRGNEARRVQLVVFTGLGLQPSFFWFTTGPEAKTFALVVPGYLTAIEDGWQDQATHLIEQQKSAEAAQLKEMAATLRHPLKGLTVIRNARIFDSQLARVGAPSDVYVLRGRIAAVLPAGSPAEGADNEINASGRVVLPGLFDMHAHTARWDGSVHLAAGVTSVRDMGNDNETLQQMLDETARGELLEPQIVPAGFLEGEGENSASQGFHVHDLQGAEKAIDWYAEHGYPQLKIYNSFPKQFLRDTTAYAHSRGMRVSGHIPVFLRAQDAVEQGYDEIQHINQVLLNFLVTPTTDTRSLDRFYLPAEKVADLDFDSKPVQDFIAFLKQHNTVIDPTLSTFAFIAQRHGEVLAPYAEFVEHMPLDIQRSTRVAQMKIPDAKTAARYRKSFDKMVEFVGRMYKAGIPLVAGTDDIPGFVLHSELEGYVKAGLTPVQALQIATWNGALYTRTLNERGSIAPGKLADLLIMEGDPTVNIADIRKVNMVITQGHWLSPTEIYRRLGVKPFVQGSVGVRSLAK